MKLTDRQTDRLRGLYVCLSVCSLTVQAMAMQPGERNRVRGEKNDFASEINQTQNKEIFLLSMNKLPFLCAEVIVQQMDFHLAPFKPSSLSQL